MATPYYGMIEEIRVMLVGNEKDYAIEIVDLLKSYNYKVKTTDTTSAALSMFSKEKVNIDVIIINVHSPDLQSFQILNQAVTLDIISIFVCDEHNELLAKKALGEGAYLYLKKPLDENIAKYLWQFVLRKKIQREQARKRSEKNKGQMDVDDSDNDNIIANNEEQPGEKNYVPNTEEQSKNIAEDNVVSNGKRKLRKKSSKQCIEEINEEEIQKTCTVWTEDLHVKFVEAVQQLGEGNCYPKQILEIMNVPDLTRMKVASHLQRCRNNKWRASKERKSIRDSSGQRFLSDSQRRSNFRKFGTMPLFQTNVSHLQCNPNQTQKVQEFPFPTLNTGNILIRRERSIQYQFYHPQLQVGGVLQQQHGPSSRRILGSQGIEGSIFMNTNYNLGLVFNNGHHHTPSDNLSKEHDDEFDQVHSDD